MSQTNFSTPTTMRCPDCLRGFEADSSGRYLYVGVDCTEDTCKEPHLHTSYYDKLDCADVHKHYILCRRCGGGARVLSTESLLLDILKALRKDPGL